jgi:CheY-like chemotaxis protein/HPt (histidine-containing phosphotransfer) domain-containing protein
VAIDLLLKERFDCVLMDVQLPVMDGYETTRLIRAHPKLSATLIIAMTANAGRDDQERCLDAGMDEFVTKPIAPKLLFNMLAKWMSQRARAASMERKVAPPPPSYFTMADGGTPPAALKMYAARVAVPPGPVVAPPAVVPQSAAAPEAAPVELFDVAALALTFSGKPDKMRKYALLFLQSARDGMKEVDAALARDDLVQLSELGHRIKSSARAVGAMQFGNLCLGLEHLRKDPDIGKARQLVQQMHAMLAVLDEHIEQELLAYDPG